MLHTLQRQLSPISTEIIIIIIIIIIINITYSHINITHTHTQTRNPRYAGNTSTCLQYCNLSANSNVAAQSVSIALHVCKQPPNDTFHVTAYSMLTSLQAGQLLSIFTLPCLYSHICMALQQRILFNKHYVHCIIKSSTICNPHPDKKNCGPDLCLITVLRWWRYGTLFVRSRYRAQWSSKRFATDADVARAVASYPQTRWRWFLVRQVTRLHYMLP
jgi:hypothetical protein